MSDVKTTSPNTELVAGMYAALLRGDMDTIADAIHEDVEWMEPDMPAIPYKSLTVGKQGVVENVLPKIIPMTYERLEFHPEELIESDSGNIVTVMGHALAKGRGRDEETFRFGHVVKLKDGLVIRFDHFVDTLKISRTLGRAVDVEQ